MTRFTLTAALVAGTLALAGCQRAPADGTSETPQPSASATAMPVEPDGGNGSGATPLANATATIPEGLRGRWGMVPADCTSTRGDAKGLIDVGADSIKFYESVGKLGEVTERDDNHIRADFLFSGEGMTWDREMSLDLADGGKTLVRKEYGEEALVGPQKYGKCS